MLLLFNNLELIEPIQRALESQGYTKPTPIQEQAIPHLLQGKDLLGCAQTGTGKTAAFAIPILQNIANQKTNKKDKPKIKALIISPTRELAIQIGDSFKTYSSNLKVFTSVVYGGVSQHPQTKQLRRGVDVLVATPGRLLDLIKQGHIKLNDVEHFVLDEADLMLDMGMIDEVKRIVKYIPEKRQTMLFSATMPAAIENLTKALLKDPVKVEVTPGASTTERIQQEVYFVDNSNKTNLLIHVLKDNEIESAIVFSRTKHGADKIVASLGKAGIQAQAIHGNKSQKQRQRALDNFKQRKTRVLVATDIAARGIDIADLSHVINYNLPEVPETYVHRIGRTGRSGNTGIAISFSNHEEKSMLRGIQKLIDKTLPVNEDNPFPLKEKPKSKSSGRGRRSNSSGRKRGSGQSNNSTRFDKSKSSDGAGKGRRNNRRRGKNNSQASKNNSGGRSRSRSAAR